MESSRLGYSVFFVRLLEEWVIKALSTPPEFSLTVGIEAWPPSGGPIVENPL